MEAIETYLERFQLNPSPTFFNEPDGRTTVEYLEISGSSIPRYINEYWTSGQRRGHSLHEISYRACFKAELPRFFISILTNNNDMVYDPFMGRGTTLLEAALLGRRVAGNDVNPLSRILVEPRINSPALREISDRLEEIVWEADKKTEIDISMFYSPSTEKKISALREYLRDRKNANEEDEVDKWIRMVATNRLTGHSSGFFSVYTMPPNQALSAESQIRINKKKGQNPPDRDVKGIIVKKSRSLQRGLTYAQRGLLRSVGSTALYFCDESQKRVPLKDECVSLVATSPPFLDTVQYASDNWLRCWFNCIDVEEVSQKITMSKTVEKWSRVMTDVFIDLKRILKPGGWIAFEVGEIRGGTIKLDEVVAPIGIGIGLKCRAIVVNKQSFTKTSNCWGIKNNSKGTNSNRIVLFQKGK